MADIAPPVLVEPIPDITLNAGSELQLDLKEHIHSPNADSGEIHFVVTLDDGDPLPEGLECTPEGVITGTVTNTAARAEPYHLLIIAKNSADIPLITYCDLSVAESALQDAEESQTQEADELAEDIFEEGVDLSLPGDEAVAAFDDTAAALDTLRDFDPERMSAEEYKALYIEYMLRRFASLQLYNADFDGELTFDAAVVEKAKTGWPIYIDGDFALSTTNPDVYDTYLNRGLFIATIQEMVGKAVDKGWKTIGVAGFDKHVGIRVVHEHNRLEMQKPEAERKSLAFDDIFQDKEWVDEMIANMPPKPGSE